MKILIADDHELFLKGLEFILNENFQHPEITTAQSYTDIFSILEQKQDFDLIITDLAMPGAAWLPALTKIHTLVPDTPITVISAVFDKEILQQTLDIGVAGYIPKTASNNLIVIKLSITRPLSTLLKCVCEIPKNLANSVCVMPLRVRLTWISQPTFL